MATLAKPVAGMRSSWRMTAACWQGHDESKPAGGPPEDGRG
ncbi:hypothetical protein ABZ853_12385 [Streptomyces albidoflavus]